MTLQFGKEYRDPRGIHTWFAGVRTGTLPLPTKQLDPLPPRPNRGQAARK
ncbi:MAG: hypothetical protein U0792_09990 [Gemmataceae bacterium]